MEFKKLMSAALMLGAMSFGATTASAKTPMLGALNTSLGTTFTDCIVCHGTAANSGGNKGITAIASSQGIVSATRDSDGDGFTDIQEVSGTLMNFNIAATTPFTIAAAAEGVAVTAAVNVVETGKAAAVTETATTDVYADFLITVPAGSEVVGDMYAATTINPSPLTYRVPVVQTGTTIYSVNKAAGTSTDVTGNTTFNTDGSITVAVAATDIVAVRVTPLTGGGSSSGGGGGCLTASVSTPLMMVFAMLTLGFFVRRKKD